MQHEARYAHISKVKKRQLCLSLQVDIEKAYKKVDWNLLRQMLHEFEFPQISEFLYESKSRKGSFLITNPNQLESSL